MNPNTPLTLPEVRQQLNDAIQRIVELRSVENQLLDNRLTPAEQLELDLRFDDTNQMIFWLGDSLKLNKKPYLLVKTLWQSSKHRAKLEILEKYVWKRSEFNFVPITTIRSLVNRTNKILQKKNFPYRIRTMKKNHREISGFFLK
ncbi:MAG: hypothetical protein LBP87_00155 [Planctomycetaceae bacterium]|jgi:DNA-binding response OmpR family regulator|nr:hypothetical protein [Planctomycetaceae bacterium]